MMKQTNGFYHTKPLTVKIARDVEPTKIKNVKELWNKLKKKERELVRILHIRKNNGSDAGTWYPKLKKLEIWVDYQNKKCLQETFYHEIGHAIFCNKTFVKRYKFSRECVQFNVSLGGSSYDLYKKLLRTTLTYLRKIEKNKGTKRIERKITKNLVLLEHEAFAEIHACSKTKSKEYAGFGSYNLVLKSYKKLMRKRGGSS